MKKLFTIIIILLIIFMMMYSYRYVLNSRKTVTAQEVQSIEEYISKIYMWKEVTGEALPKFNNINEAPQVWIWEVVNKNLDKYEIIKEDIYSKAKELFGDEFNIEFPDEGSEFIVYNEEIQKYYTTGMGLDDYDDSFIINDIQKTKKGYSVDVIEYLIDYTEAKNIDYEEEIDEEEYNINICNLNGEVIETIKNTDGNSKIIEIVKKNINKFNLKNIDLIKDSESKLYVKRVK